MALVHKGDHAQACDHNGGNMMDEYKDRHDQQEGFLGGPSYVSLLLSFADHVALRLWEGEVRMKICLFNMYY